MLLNEGCYVSDSQRLQDCSVNRCTVKGAWHKLQPHSAPVWTGGASETCSSNGIGHRVSRRCALLLKVFKEKIWLWHREDQKHNLSGSLLLIYRDHHHQTKKIIHVRRLVTNKQFIQMCRETVLIGRGHDGVFCSIEVFLELYLAMELISKHWCLQYIFTKVKCLTMKHWAISVSAWAGVEQIPQASCLFILIMCQGNALSFHLIIFWSCPAIRDETQLFMFSVYCCCFNAFFIT